MDLIWHSTLPWWRNMVLTPIHCARADFIPRNSFCFSHVTCANAALLSCLPAFSCCSDSGLGVWACNYRNHTEGQSRGEEGEALTYEWRVGTSQWRCSPLIGCRHPIAPPTPLCHDYHHFYCKTRDCCCCCWLSLTLCISVYWVFVRDAVVHV